MTPQEALAEALALAVTAPTDEAAADVVKMAEMIAADLSDIDILLAKKKAIAMIHEGKYDRD